MNILAIETSCDETACAIVQAGVNIVSSCAASSTSMHKKWGGIVPEIAAREQLSSIIPVLSEALSPVLKDSIHSTPLSYIKTHIDAIAVTVGPGLIGSLLVGVETAKVIAYACNKPIIPVNHVLAHIYANFVFFKNKGIPNSNNQIPNNIKIQNSKFNASISSKLEANSSISFPAIALVVSGGHTELYLMKSIKELQWIGGTIDDAAGECFDKTARIIGLGHGGGVAIEQSSQLKENNSKFEIRNSKFSLPRPMMHDSTLNFSFSGLKTAVSREWEKASSPTAHHPSRQSLFAYEIQEAITDVLVYKTMKAADQHKVKSILIAGGVAANSRLKEQLNCKLKTINCKLVSPPPPLCTDNAAAIGSYAFFRGKPDSWKNIEAIPDMNVEVNI